MKKVMSLILSMALLASLVVIGSVPVSAIDIPLPDQVLGRGIPNVDNLCYRDGNYEMKVAVSSPSTFSVKRNSNVLQIADSSYRHDIYSQIKYPADAGTGKLTFSFKVKFNGIANSMKLKVYDKSMTAYGSYSLLWGTPTQFKASGNETYNTTNAKDYVIKYTVDLEAGTYSGSVNGNVFNDIGNYTKSYADFAERGIGMVEFIVNTGYQTSGTGIWLCDASVSDGDGNALASGIPYANVHNYTSGDYSLGIVCDPSYYTKPIITQNSTIEITDRDTEHYIKSQIKYPADASLGTLRYDFDVTYIGSPGWRTKFNVYDKNLSSVKSFQVVNASSPNRYQHSSWPYVSTSGTDRLSFEVNLATGAYSFYVTQASNKYVLSSSTLEDLSNGIGMIEFAYESGTTAGAGIILKNAAVTQIERGNVISDHRTLIDGVPSSFGTYNGLNLSSTAYGTASVSINNGKIVMSNATDESNNYARLNFEKTISSADNGRTAFIEVTFTASETLTGTTGLRFNAKDPNGGWPITGANLVSSSNPIEKDTEYTLGIWLDFSAANRFVAYRNGVKYTEGKLSTDAGIANIFLEYYNPDSATLTINDISYTVIEPSNYDAETDTYYTSDVMLLNGMPHYNNATSWTQNNISFAADKFGTASMERLPMCGGIKFTGTDNSREDGSDDYARLTLTPNASQTTFPEGVVYARWDFTLEGSADQQINIASRGSGSWPINHHTALSAGEHTFEFVYNPKLNMYKCIYDGDACVLRDHIEASLPDIVLEWHGQDKADVMTLKNVRLMNIKEADFDQIGEIAIAEDGMSANVNVHVAEKFNFIEGDAVLIIAAYDGNKLTNVNFTSKELARGDNEFDVALKSLNGGAKVKAFLWNSVADLVPLTAFASK